MDYLFFLELFSVLTFLGFLILLIYQNIWCWPLGIISSAASIFLFYSTKLYAESILYFYYVFIGIYGWYVWNKKRETDLKVKTEKSTFHLIIVITGIVLSLLLGLIFNKYTDAQRPYADSSSTIFSFIASYMQAHKILSSWVFWIIINLFSVWLYLDRGLKMYSGLMVINFLLSVVGYLQWKKSYDHEPAKSLVKAT